MDRRMYSNPTGFNLNPRTNMTQQTASNSYIPSNGNNRPVTNFSNNVNNYVGHGLKRMRGDDFRNDGMSAPHRMKLDSNDDEKSLSFVERHDVDQRSEIYGQYTNITLNETSVLCFTIRNPKYPITLDVIRKICAITGQILRISILRQIELQALVEFDSIETARRIKDELNGADIYSGCCTLKIDFANLKSLHIPINDQDNIDLTMDDLRYQRRRTLLSSPPRNDRFDPSTMNKDSFLANSNFPSYNRFTDPRNDSSRNYNFTSSHGKSQHNDGHNVPLNFERLRDSNSPNRTNSIQDDNNVFNIEGLLSPRWNCDRIFNLLCLYGNVSRVKFLKSKQGGAMVQMNRCDNLRLHLKSLNAAFIFGQKFVIAHSRQSEIQPMNRPFYLENGDLSYVEYDTNRNNRYLTNEQALKNRPVAPSHVLYYFNTPPNMTEVDIVRFFEDVGAKRPLKVKNFLQRKESNHDRSRRHANQPKGVTGLAEFRTITDACECLILANNYPIPHESSNWPFFFKLTFSSTPITDQDARIGDDIDTSLATVTIENGRRHHEKKSNDDENRSDSPQEHRRHRHSSPTN